MTAVLTRTAALTAQLAQVFCSFYEVALNLVLHAISDAPGSRRPRRPPTMPTMPELPTAA